MTLGFSTYGLKDLSTVDAIRTLAGIGYDAVELTVWGEWDANPETQTPEKIAQIRQALEETGLELTSLMENLTPSEDDAEHQLTLERLSLSASLGVELSPEKPPVIQTTLGGGDFEKKKALYLKRLKDWATATGDKGVTLAIKPHRGGGLSQPAEAVELIEELGKPEHLRMCYDYSHYDFRDLPMEETIATALPYTAHIAVKDAVMDEKTGKVRFVNPGESGRIDYAKLIRLFHDGGYRGDICTEVSSQVWRREGYDGVTAAKECYARIAPKFEEAGVKRGR